MKTVDKTLAIIAMFWLVLAILITSFQIAIYGDSDYAFYEKEYAKYNVTESLNMKMEDVMEVTDYMMDYLIGKEEELSIITQVDGEEQDFFNEQDRLHMFDVKNLFLGGLSIRNVLVVAFLGVVLILKFRKAELKKLLPTAYSIALAIFLGILLLLGIAFTVDFTACFTIFHKIFFTNDLWLFDPRTDYMIRMLPEGFFADMVVRIVLFFLGFLAVLFVIMQGWKRYKKR